MRRLVDSSFMALERRMLFVCRPTREINENQFPTKIPKMQYVVTIDINYLPDFGVCRHGHLRVLFERFQSRERQERLAIHAARHYQTLRTDTYLWNNRCTMSVSVCSAVLLRSSRRRRHRLQLNVQFALTLHAAAKQSLEETQGYARQCNARGREPVRVSF